MSPENEDAGSFSYYDEEVVRQSDKGIGLFIDGDDYEQNAYLTHWHDGKGFFIYPTGYKLAAERLVELTKTEPYNADYLVFPISHCLSLPPIPGTSLKATNSRREQTFRQFYQFP